MHCPAKKETQKQLKNKLDKEEREKINATLRKSDEKSKTITTKKKQKVYLFKV